MEWNIDTVKTLIDEVDRSGLSTFTLEAEGVKLHLEKPQTMQAAVQAKPAPAACAPQEAPAADKPAEPCGNVVTSPIVGTFYASASPEKPAYVKVGQQVKKGDVLFIVESMKLMNEINSEYDGMVAEIYVRDGQALEYGQPVMRIA